MEDYFKEVGCLNLILDIPINYQDNALEEIPCYMSVDRLVDASYKEHLYGIFPCKGNKCIVFYYNYGKLLKTALCDDKGKLTKFNNYGLSVKENLTEIPEEVEELCIMQLNELEKGEDIFKLWVHSDSKGKEDTFIPDYMTVTNFRVSMLMKDVIYSGYVNTITNDQNRLPNSGVVTYNKWNTLIDFFKQETQEQQQTTLF